MRRYYCSVVSHPSKAVSIKHRVVGVGFGGVLAGIYICLWYCISYRASTECTAAKQRWCHTNMSLNVINVCILMCNVNGAYISVQRGIFGCAWNGCAVDVVVMLRSGATFGSEWRLVTATAATAAEGQCMNVYLPRISLCCVLLIWIRVACRAT